MIRLRLALVAALSLTAGVAMADTLPPLTPEQSASLARALRLWSFGLVGDASAFTATPADGHYDIRIPIQGIIGGSGLRVEAGPVTGEASLDADGHWRFDAIALPSPLRTVWTAEPGGKQAESTETFESQTGHATVDPSLTGNSTGETVRLGGKVVTKGGGPPVTLTFARAATHEEWVPASPGRVDTASVTRADTIALRMGADGGPAGGDEGVVVGHASMTVQSLDADVDRATALAHRALVLIGSLPQGGDTLSPEQRAELHGLVAQSRNLARQTKMTVDAEGIGVALGDYPFNLGHLVFSEAVAAPDGKLDLRLRLEVSGLDLPDTLPGAIRDVVPRHLVFAPYMTGAPVGEAYAMADEMIDEDQGKDGQAKDALAEHAQRRLAKSPVTVGVEELAFDIGPATLSAKGELTISAPGTMDGTAVIEATGLDALVRQASKDPMLKRAVPVLIFLKGIGEQTGKNVVWNVTYKGGKFKVNGTDMSGMMPGR